MIQLAQDVFDAQNDPSQLDVDEQVIAKLQQLHPATVSEYDNGEGPAVWILLIPTTTGLMQELLQHRIGETELLNLTSKDVPFEAIYLCSAMVLPEFRGKGIAKRLTLEAIESIRSTNPVSALFVWPFSSEGTGLAASIAAACGLPLLTRERRA